MALRSAQKGDTVQYRNSDGETLNATVAAVQGTAPATPTTSTSATGGTLIDGTYSYRVTAVVDGIESPASPAKTQVVPVGTTTNTVTVNFTAVARATAHKIYGRTSGTELLLATITMPTVTYTDTGAATPLGALPTNNGNVTLWTAYTGMNAITGVAKATAMKQTNRYYLR